MAVIITAISIVNDKIEKKKTEWKIQQRAAAKSIVRHNKFYNEMFL